MVETVVSLKTVPSIPVAIGILAEVVVAIGTKEGHYIKGEIDVSSIDLDKRNTAFAYFPVWTKE